MVIEIPQNNFDRPQTQQGADLSGFKGEIERIFATALVLLGSPHKAEEILIAAIEGLQEGECTPESFRREAIRRLIRAQLPDEIEF